MRVRALLAGAAAAVAVGLLAAVVVIDGSGAETDPFAGVPLADDNPGLTSAEEEAVLTITEEDSRLRELLGEGALDIREVGVWGERDAEGARRAVGAVVLLRLDGRRDFAVRDWPTVDYENGENDCDSTGVHYSETTAQFGAENAGGMLVHVDLNKERVVGIEPIGGELIPGPSLEPRTPSAGC